MLTNIATRKFAEQTALLVWKCECAQTAVADSRAHRQGLQRQRRPFTLHRAQHSDELHMHSLLLFLSDWYTNHVENLDHQYGAWLNERGIA
jgi:hemerythrin